MSTWMFESLPEEAFCPRPGGGMRLYKKSSPGAAPPDPALVAAQIKSMGIQDSVIQQIMANNQDMLPLQRQQLQFGLDSAKTAYQQSQDDRTYALGKREQYDAALKPLVEEATSFDEQARSDELYGKASADISQQANSARDQMRRQMERTGANPSDGLMVAMERKTSMDEALGKALAGSKAREAAKIEGRGLKTNLVNTLGGFQSQAAGLSGNGANFGASGINMTNASAAGVNSGLTAAGGLAGQMGSNATNMYTAQGNFNLANQKLKNEDPNAALYGAIGSVAGSFMKSDVNAKTNIRGLRPGAALEAVKAIDSGQSWQYKPDSDAADGGQTHVGPMAQDVNAVLGEQAAPGGKAIDLVTLNGVNMAATRELAQEVDALKAGMARMFHGGLRANNAHGNMHTENAHV